MKNSRKIQIATQILKNLYKFIFMRKIARNAKNKNPLKIA